MQKVPRVFREMDDIRIAVHHERRRPKPLEQLKVTLPPFKTISGALGGVSGTRLIRRSLRAGRRSGHDRTFEGMPARRQGQRRRTPGNRQALPRCGAAGVNAEFFVEGGKQCIPLVHGFRDAEKQQRFHIQGKVKNLQRLLLRLAIEIDHEVPTTHEIQPGERRILQKIMKREKDRFPQFTFDPVASGCLGEEPAEAVLGNVRRNDLRVKCVTPVLDRAFIEIGGKNLD